MLVIKSLALPIKLSLDINFLFFYNSVIEVGGKGNDSI